jgi:serine/threonine protein kinase
VTPAHVGHEATCEETIDAKLRLNTQTILDHAAALSSAIDTANAAGWALRTEWLPFMQDVDNLALSLDKLGDGSLAQARRVRDVKEKRLKSHCGTPAYLAAEIVTAADARVGYMGPPVDMWALGCVLYELIHRKPAFKAEEAYELEGLIQGVA